MSATHDRRHAGGDVRAVLHHDRRGASRDGVAHEGVPVGALAAQRDEERAGPNRARVARDRVDRRRECSGDARAREGRDEPGGLSHQRVPFAVRARRTKRVGVSSGMKPAWSIAARASSAKTGAATCEP